MVPCVFLETDNNSFKVIVEKFHRLFTRKACYAERVANFLQRKTILSQRVRSRRIKLLEFNLKVKTNNL